MQSGRTPLGRVLQRPAERLLDFRRDRIDLGQGVHEMDLPPEQPQRFLLLDLGVVQHRGTLFPHRGTLFPDPVPLVLEIGLKRLECRARHADRIVIVLDAAPFAAPLSLIRRRPSAVPRRIFSHVCRS